MALFKLISCAAFAVAKEQSVFLVHKGRNTYNGWGSEDMDGNHMWSGRSADDCKNICLSTEGCDCAVYVDEDSWNSKAGDCFLRAKCEASDFQKVDGFEVFEKHHVTEAAKKAAKESVKRSWDHGDADRLAAIDTDMQHTGYEAYINTNTYHGHGSHDLPGDYLWNPMTPRTCTMLCTALRTCDCAVYVHVADFGFKAGDCFMRANCTPQHFQHGVRGFEVLVANPHEISNHVFESARQWVVENLLEIHSCESGEHGCRNPAQKHSERAKAIIAELKKEGGMNLLLILIIIGVVVLVVLAVTAIFLKPSAPKTEEETVLLEETAVVQTATGTEVVQVKEEIKVVDNKVVEVKEEVTVTEVK